MRVRRFVPEEVVGPRGFSGWSNPVMRGYLMACCDCGLVHEMDFKAIRVTKKFKDGRYVYDELPRTEYRVTMRARRAEGHTRNLRGRKC